MIRFILKVSSEVELLFENPGNQAENPKVFGESRRDMTATSDHMCTVFFDDPMKWQEILKCKCKRGPTVFICLYCQICAKVCHTWSYQWTCSRGDQECWTKHSSTVWFWCWCKQESAKYSNGSKKYILSLDTDVYHIGCLLNQQRK